jgi:hypothetical protein
VIGRALTDVREDWERMGAQLRELLATLPTAAVANYQMESVKVSLGFSAEGKLAFIAKVGLEASIELEFKRRS